MSNTQSKRRTGRPPHRSAEFELPLPPSNNALYANARLGGRVKTAQYRNWITDAGWSLKQQGIRHLPGHVGISLVAGTPDCKRDLDNVLKASADLLTTMRVIEDDSLVTEIHAKWDATVPANVMRIVCRQVSAPEHRPSLAMRKAAAERMRVRAEQRRMGAVHA